MQIPNEITLSGSQLTNVVILIISHIVFIKFHYRIYQITLLASQLTNVGNVISRIVVFK